MNKLKLLSVLIIAFLLVLSGRGACDFIHNIQISPGSPASLAFNQNVNITFDYNTNEAGGVVIFVRPFSNGALTPQYGAHPSPLYPVGSGSGTGFFTISSGEVVIDQLRFQMLNADQTRLILEFFVPVNYIFSSHAIFNIQVNPLPPASLPFNQNVNITFDYVTNEASGVLIFVRPFTDGSLTPNYGAHGSPLYSAGSGTGTGFFTITSGEVVVDHLRFRMVTADQSQVLLEFLLPVEYIFAPNSITNIQLSPRPPASLVFNQNIDITFDYLTEEAGGVNIFVRPYSNGALTPNYAAHPSPLHPAGNGSGTGFFTITSGEVKVDSLRFKMVNADQSKVLVEFFMPVEYLFSSHAISNVQFSPLPPAYFAFNQNVNLTFDYNTNEAGGVLIFARPYTNGSLTPNYAAHPSPLHSVGTDSGTGFFTITAEDAIVDALRFQMLNSDQSSKLLELFVPVEYHYGFTSLPTSVPLSDSDVPAPTAYALQQNYPNPFNPSTTIRYTLHKSGFASLKIFNLAGQEIESLVNGYQKEGEYQVNWIPEGLPSGIYFYRLHVADFYETKKLIVQK